MQATQCCSTNNSNLIACFPLIRLSRSDFHAVSKHDYISSLPHQTIQLPPQCLALHVTIKSIKKCPFSRSSAFIWGQNQTLRDASRDTGIIAQDHTLLIADNSDITGANGTCQTSNSGERTRITPHNQDAEPIILANAWRDAGESQEDKLNMI